MRRGQLLKGVLFEWRDPHCVWIIQQKKHRCALHTHTVHTHAHSHSSTHSHTNIVDLTRTHRPLCILLTHTSKAHGHESNMHNVSEIKCLWWGLSNCSVPMRNCEQEGCVLFCLVVLSVFFSKLLAFKIKWIQILNWIHTYKAYITSKSFYRYYL